MYKSLVLWYNSIMNEQQQQLEQRLIRLNDALCNRGIGPSTGFTYHHMFITNPYMDSDGRFQSQGDPAAIYGEAYLKSCFCVDTQAAIDRATDQLCDDINS